MHELPAFSVHIDNDFETTAADDDLGPMYREDTVLPFAIDLATLPRYPLLPTLLVHPDDLD